MQQAVQFRRTETNIEPYMTLIFSLSAWLIALLLTFRSEWSYQSLARLNATKIAQNLPSLSIIIPARNEAENLPRLLASLRQLVYPGPLEILVVDDQSNDATAQIAVQYGVSVLSLGTLTPGWLGKPHACQRGVEATRSDLILFTDADTFHAPESAAAAVSYLVENQLDGLSMFLQQHTRYALDASALMVAFAALFAGSSQQTGLLNGQYILLKRETYLNSGGFAAVRNRPLEDVALGKLLQRGGYRVALLRGEHLAGVQMYQSLRQLWNGLTRLGSGALHETGPAAILTMLHTTLIASPLVLFPLFPLSLSLFFWASAAIFLIAWAKRFGSILLCFLAPAAATLIVASGVWGVAQQLTKRGNLWKGRRV